MQALAGLITSIVSGEASEAVARARRAAAIYLLAGILALAGLAFLIVAGFVATAKEIGTIEAALAFGGGFLILAIVIVSVYRIGARLRARRIAKKRRSEARAVAGAAAIAILPALLASRTGAIALGAPAIAALAYAVYRENTARKNPDDTGRPE